MTSGPSSSPSVLDELYDLVNGAIQADIQGIQATVEVISGLTNSINSALGVGGGSDPFAAISSLLSSVGDGQTNLQTALNALFSEVFDLKNFVEEYYTEINGIADDSSAILDIVTALQNPTQVPDYLKCVIANVCSTKTYSYEDLGIVQDSGSTTIVYSDDSQSLVGVLAVVASDPLPPTVSIVYGDPNVMRLGTLALGLASTVGATAFFSPVEYHFANQFLPSPLPQANQVYWRLPQGLQVHLYAYLQTVTLGSVASSSPPMST